MNKMVVYALLGVLVKEIAALPKSTSPATTPQTPGFEAIQAVGLLSFIIYMLKRRNELG